MSMVSVLWLLAECMHGLWRMCLLAVVLQVLRGPAAGSGGAVRPVPAALSKAVTRRHASIAPAEGGPALLLLCCPAPA
jgi:hypothetical protein